MATVVAQHGHHLGRHLGFFKKNISKVPANFLESSRKRVFTASNMDVIKNRKEKRLSKITVFIFKL